MLVTIVVSLYTSRIVLKVLGVNDYGIYNVVGGIVGMLSFLNSALSNGTSRFITYEMGKGNIARLRNTFQNSFVIHFILAVIILVIGETAGLWFIYNKAEILPDRIDAAMVAYHASIIAAVISITQVPYTSLIISHEKMDFYAYMAIIDVFLKLFIVYILQFSNTKDKLITYSILILFTQLVGIIITFIFCKRNFIEATLSQFKLDKTLAREILGFSSWSLVGNLSGVLNNQGMTIITNIFFGPAIVSARAISITVNVTLSNFVSNFRTAANPQIIKLYASGETDNSKKLLLSTTRFSFMLMLLLGVPLICVCDKLLGLWLVKVPEYTGIFVKLIIVQSMIYTFDTCFYTGLYACGKVKENALISPMYYFMQFAVVYGLFVLGFSPITLSIAGIITSLLVITTAKPFLLRKYAGYSLYEVYHMLWRCFYTAIAALPLPILAYYFIPNNVNSMFVRCLVSIVGVAASILFLGIDQGERLKVLNFIKQKISR